VHEKVIKNKRLATVVAAQKAIDAIQEMDFREIRASKAELEVEDPPSLGTLCETAWPIIEEQLKD